MEKIVRYRKAFYQKQNDFQNGNIKHYQSTFKNDQNLPYEPHQTAKRREAKQKNCTELFCEVYANEALGGLGLDRGKTLFLANHKIDALLRARMLDWMIEVTSSYKFTDKGYFDSVQLMDKYFEKQTTSLLSNQLHIVGVTSMLIASKINELNPLKIKTVFEKIAHRKLSLNDLLATEARITEKLDYRLNSSTFFDFACIKLTTFFYSGRKALSRIEKNFNQLSSFNSEQALEKVLAVACFLSRLTLFDYDFYCQHSHLLLAECIVKTSLEIAKLDQTGLYFSNSAVQLQLCKVQMFKGIRRFRQSFKGLNNIFKFTSKDIVKLVQSSVE